SGLVHAYSFQPSSNTRSFLSHAADTNRCSKGSFARAGAALARGGSSFFARGFVPLESRPARPLRDGPRATTRGGGCGRRVPFGTHARGGPLRADRSGERARATPVILPGRACASIECSS